MGIKFEANPNAVQDFASNFEQAFMEKVQKGLQEKLVEYILTLQCEQCRTEKSYRITNFEANDYTVTAYLQCSKCGYQDKCVANGKLDSSADKTKKDVIDSIKSLESAFSGH
jgi:hypothetical protein